MKDSVIWNIESGLPLTGLDVSQAHFKRGQIFQNMVGFMDKYDYLLMPVSQVVPFSVDTEWVKNINGVEMETYIDWMMSCSLITITEHPAASVPAGFTDEGFAGWLTNCRPLPR